MVTGWRALLLTIVATVAVGAVVAEGSAASASTADDPGTYEAQMFAVGRHVSVQRATEILGQQALAATLALSLAESYPDSYAGLEDAGEGDAIIAHLADQGTEKGVAEQARELGIKNFTVTRASYSYRSMSRIQLAVAQRLLIEELPANRFSASIDVANNRVVVSTNLEVTSLESIKRELQQAVPFDGYDFDSNYLPSDLTTCNVAACLPPARAGVELDYAINGGNSSVPSCSSGFVGRDRTTNNWEILTAGHCGTHTWNSNNTGLGNTHAISYGNGIADAQAVEFFDPNYWNPGHWVYQRDGNELFPITSVMLNSGFVPGQYLCQTGYVSQHTNCGSITVVQTSVTYPNGVLTDAFRWTACVRLGDSGGPIWNSYSNRAFGLNSGRTTVNGAAECSAQSDGLAAVGGSAIGSKIQNDANMTNFNISAP